MKRRDELVAMPGGCASKQKSQLQSLMHFGFHMKSGVSVFQGEASRRLLSCLLDSLLRGTLVSLKSNQLRLPGEQEPAAALFAVHLGLAVKSLLHVCRSRRWTI